MIDERKNDERLYNALRIVSEMSDEEYRRYVFKKMDYLDDVMFAFVQTAVCITDRLRAVIRKEDLENETRTIAGWCLTGAVPEDAAPIDIKDEELND